MRLCYVRKPLQRCQHCRVPFRHPKREKPFKFLTWEKLGSIKNRWVFFRYILNSWNEILTCVCLHCRWWWQRCYNWHCHRSGTSCHYCSSWYIYCGPTNQVSLFLFVYFQTKSEIEFHHVRQRICVAFILLLMCAYVVPENMSMQRCSLM